MNAITPNRRKRDAGKTRLDIIEAATAEFAASGLSGARVDAIAARTRTTKRMIYYYFGSKEGLYEAVLAKAYGGIRDVESRLADAVGDPEAAMRQLIEASFDYHAANPEFIRLVMIENIHNAEYISASNDIKKRNDVAITTLADLLRRGHAMGIFKVRAEPIDIHMMISSLCFYRVSNRYTFEALFSCDLNDPGVRSRHRRMVVETVIRYLRGD
ncbi:MAG TPA: TetR/AcrR family transcriptional regulator [Acetobacteraceae bacterium]|nr:TetR/AcrR family transcriptional regulator [Acetobacteraceae bacterium]